MLQEANTDLFNPLVHKAHNSECQIILFPLQIKPSKRQLKLNWRYFVFCTLGTNGLKKQKEKEKTTLPEDTREYAPVIFFRVAKARPKIAEKFVRLCVCVMCVSKSVFAC